MDGADGWIEVTVLSDSAEAPGPPRRMTVAISRISSLAEAGERLRAGVPGCAAEIVLAEPLGFEPWVFRAGDDEPPAPCRVLAVAEHYDVLKTLVQWASRRPGIQSQREWDAFVHDSSHLAADVTVGRPLRVRRRLARRGDGGSAEE